MSRVLGGRPQDHTAYFEPSVINWDKAVSLVASHLIIDASQKRRGLILLGPFAGRVTLANAGPVVLDSGLTLSGTMGTLILCRYLHGDIVCKPWFGIGSASTAILSWIEVMES